MELVEACGRSTPSRSIIGYWVADCAYYKHHNDDTMMMMMMMMMMMIKSDRTHLALRFVPMSSEYASTDLPTTMPITFSLTTAVALQYELINGWY